MSRPDDVVHLDFEEEIDRIAANVNAEGDEIRRYVGEYNGSVNSSMVADIKYQQALRSDMIYICRICTRHYRSQSRALIHISKVHQIPNLDAIDYCGSGVRNTDVLWERVTLTVEQQLTELESRRNEHYYRSSPYKCHSCAMSFSFKDTFKNHNIRHHENNGSFMCDICFSLFTNETELMRHERYHKDRYKCSICGYLLKCHTFISTRFTHEAMHARSVLNGDSMVFTCSYCNNIFKDQKLLGAHIRNSHFFPELYTCPVCEKVLTTKTGINVHMGIHSIKSPYKCYECGQSFTTIRKKRIHVAHCQLPNRFTCNYCDEDFKTKNEIRHHISINHSNKCN